MKEALRVVWFLFSRTNSFFFPKKLTIKIKTLRNCLVKMGSPIFFVLGISKTHAFKEHIFYVLYVFKNYFLKNNFQEHEPNST